MEKTREHILKTALKLFLQKNFKEVTMQEIVKETGLSKGAFYHYFLNKEQVFLEAVETFYFVEDINNDYSKLPTHSLKEFCAEMLGYMKKMIEYIKNALGMKFEEDDNHTNISYYTLIFDAIRRFPNFREKMSLFYQRDLNMWEKTIENAINSGEIETKMDIKMVALMFLNTIDATFINYIVQNNFLESLNGIKIIWDNFYMQLKK